MGLPLAWMAAPALWATDPTPLPTGWGALGPVNDAGHGVVSFSTDDCAVHVAVVDVDGGPYARDVRIARLWDGTRWAWADDWRVVDGKLVRPGRRPVPPAEVAEALELDPVGRVVARVRDGRRVTILRDAEGRFVGMASGAVEARLVEDRAESTTGAAVTYAWDGARLLTVERGADTIRLEYALDALVAVRWPDATLKLDAEGTSGLGGRWRCEAGDDRVRIQHAQRTWTVERGEGELRVTDPAGARHVTRWVEGALLGWTDADGVTVRVERGEDGRVSGVRRGAERVATLRWSGAELVSFRDATDGTWTLVRSPDGVAGRSEPDGRTVAREVGEGRVRRLERGSEVTTAAWDGDGRLRRLVPAGLGELQLERDGAGELRKVHDPVGGVWTIVRAGGEVRVTAPDGGEWRLKFDGAGRLEAVQPPGGAGTRVTRTDGQVTQLSHAGHLWTWTRDPAGLVGAIGAPDGSSTRLSRDPAGVLVGVRLPDGGGYVFGRDGLGRVRSIGDHRLVRDAAGRIIEVRGPTGPVGGWSRDGAGRVTGFGAGEVEWGISRDAAGRVQAVSAGDAARWKLERDGAGRVVLVTDAAGEAPRVSRDGGGRVVKVADPVGAVSFVRDMRGRIARVTTDRVLTLGRDAVGRVVRAESPDLGTFGADYETSGALKLLRFPDGTLVRRNVSADAGELVAVDRDGKPAGHAGWSADALGRVVERAARTLLRDPVGRLMQAGTWSWQLGRYGDERVTVRTSAEGRPQSAALAVAGPWGLGVGELTYRWSEDGALTGLDGSAGWVGLVHDALGRLVQLSLGERALAIERDGFGRLRRIGGTVLVGWDGLLQLDDQLRVPFGLAASARAGGAVFTDVAAVPMFVPWAGALSPAPTGLADGVDAAELGAGGRYVLPGGVLVDLLRAVDPLSGVATAPDRWPWTPIEAEPGLAAPPFPAVDDAADAFWDAAPFDTVEAWSDPVARIAAWGALPGGEAEPMEAPGVPWLPASTAREVPAAVAGHGGVLVDEGPVGNLVVAAALSGGGLTEEIVLRALLADELSFYADQVPGVALPAPAFLRPALANPSFRH